MQLHSVSAYFDTPSVLWQEDNVAAQTDQKTTLAIQNYDDEGHEQNADWGWGCGGKCHCVTTREATMKADSQLRLLVDCTMKGVEAMTIEKRCLDTAKDNREAQWLSFLALDVGKVHILSTLFEIRPRLHDSGMGEFAFHQHPFLHWRHFAILPTNNLFDSCLISLTSFGQIKSKKVQLYTSISGSKSSQISKW